ncbi:MAG: hypothetical protein HKN87_04850 [Saprospiraceae bacterium]|nr:hypothetical protein [Saprospiraceae bacterium]
MVNYSVVLIVLTTGLLLACENPQKAPDVSHIEVSSKIVRFEQELFSLDTNQLGVSLDRLMQDHPGFSDVFFYQIIADPQNRDEVEEVVSWFLGDSLIEDMARRVGEEFGDFAPQAKSLKSALQYFAYYFPDKAIPDIYTCISGFEVGAFSIGDELLGAGLEFYLGADYPHYDPNLFPVYIQQTMKPEFLVAKTIHALIANHMSDLPGTRLIDYMVKNGAELYIKEKLLPEEDPEIIHEFTEKQMAWVKENEAAIWAFLLEQELLYSIEYRKFQKLITPSPNVPNMPPEAPGRAGNWVGYRIVKAYMQTNQDQTLEDLLQIEDAQQILAESKYKPRQ